MIKKIILSILIGVSPLSILPMDHSSSSSAPAAASSALMAAAAAAVGSPIPAIVAPAPAPAPAPLAGMQLQMHYTIVPRRLDAAAITTLEGILGYEFKDKSLLVQALTTRAKNPTKNYEAFEYLGDKILDAIIAKMLLALYPQAREGMLTDARQAIVRQEPMAALCLRLGLHNYLQHIKPTINLSRLCDLTETVIGAIYEDGGADSAQNFVLKFFMPMIQNKECPKEMLRIINQAAVQANENINYVWAGNICQSIRRGAGTGVVARNFISNASKTSPKRLSCYLAERHYIKTQLPAIWQNSLVRLATDSDYQPLVNFPSLNLSWQEGLQANSRVRLHTLMQRLNTELPRYNVQENDADISRFACSFDNPIFAHIVRQAPLKSLAKENAACAAYQEMQKSIMLSQDLEQITDMDTALDPQDPIASLNLFCQAHRLDCPTYNSFFKEKKGDRAIYTKCNAPWLITEIKGPSRPLVDQARTEAAKRIVALMHYLNTDYVEPKKLDALARYKQAAEPINFMIYCCQCLGLEQPTLETHICEGPVSEGMHFQTTITLGDCQFGKKQIVGIKAPSKSEAQKDAAKKASEHMINKIIKNLIKQEKLSTHQRSKL